MKNKLIIIIILAFATKLILLLIVNKNLIMNPDEEHNYQIAFNHQNGNDYSIYDTQKGSFKLTAFHGSFTVFIYDFLIKHGIKKEIWVLFMHSFSLILFALSINYFHKLCLHFLDNEKHAFFSTITYCFYPSILFYIGTLYAYENIVLSLLVIIIFRLLSAIKNGFVKTDYFIVPITISLSCLLRPQMIAIYSVILFIYAFVILIKKSFRLIPLLLLTISFTFLFHIPILLKNKKLFGEYVLSTQSGFEFLQGHNPTAKGSWMGNWKNPKNQLYNYSHSQIKNISELNELEESKARHRVALKWIIENPADEIKLIVRKIAIYFLPMNYEVLYGSNIVNPINLFIHMFFLLFVLTRLCKKSIKLNELLIFSPIAASIILSIVFFVGYRWRYYAEPFMIIFAWQFISILKDNYNRRKMPSP